MELRDIEYFAVVAEHGHIGRAAESMGLSQPALSKSLRRLEDALQVKLFRRNPKGVELTAEGSVLLLRARELQLSVQNVAREVADISQGRAGQIRIGVGPIVLKQFLSAAFGEFLREAPRTSMKVTVSDADEIIPALRNGQLDVVINLMHATPPEGLVYVHLYDDEFVVCGSTAHRLSGRTQVSLAELSNERWAQSESVLPTQQRLREAFRDNGLAPPHIAFESRSVALRLQTAASSDLLLYISRTVVQEAVAVGHALQALPVKQLAWLRPVGAIHRQERYLSPAVVSLIEILKRVAKRVAFGRGRDSNARQGKKDIATRSLT